MSAAPAANEFRACSCCRANECDRNYVIWLPRNDDVGTRLKIWHGHRHKTSGKLWRPQGCPRMPSFGLAVASGAFAGASGNQHNTNQSETHRNLVSGYLKAVLPEISGPVFGRLSAKVGPETPLERRGSSCNAGGTKKFRPHCLQVPSNVDWAVELTITMVLPP
jgi:hypothetical protein